MSTATATEDEPKQQFKIYLSPAVAQRLRLAKARRRDSFSTIAEQAIAGYLGGKPSKPGPRPAA